MTSPSIVPPTFSVVVPAYEAAHELPFSIATVWSQTYPPTEVIVVDDGSNDETAEVARTSGARVVRTPHRGVGAARNTGIRHARAEWIAFLDADDRWSSLYLRRLADAIGTTCHADGVFTDYAIDDGGVISPSARALDAHLRSAASHRVAPAIDWYAPGCLVNAYLRSRTFVQTSALAVRRATLLRLGGYDEHLQVGEDFELLLRLLSSSPVLAIAEPLTTYRRPAGSLMDRFAVESFDWERRVWQRETAFARRYPPELAARLAAAWPLRLHDAAISALRSGRFATARARFREARAAGFSAALSMEIAAAALDNAFGRSLYSGAKAVRRLRFGVSHQ